MNAVKFLKIDLIRTNSQNRLLVLFAVVALLMSLKGEAPIWSLLYLCFGSVILAATPFATHAVSNGGFLNMLPATNLSRVIGRYLYSLAITGLGFFFGILSIAIYYGIKHEIPAGTLFITLIILAVTVSTNAIQYLVFYFLGNMKSQYFMAIIRMIPGFAMFFGGSVVIDYIAENSETGISWITWIIENLEIVAGALLILSIIILILCIGISNIILSRRDDI